MIEPRKKELQAKQKAVAVLCCRLLVSESGALYPSSEFVERVRRAAKTVSTTAAATFFVCGLPAECREAVRLLHAEFSLLVSKKDVAILMQDQTINSIEHLMHLRVRCRTTGIRQLVVVTADYHADRVRRIVDSVFFEADVSVPIVSLPTDFLDGRRRAEALDAEHVKTHHLRFELERIARFKRLIYLVNCPQVPTATDPSLQPSLVLDMLIGELVYLVQHLPSRRKTVLLLTSLADSSLQISSFLCGAMPDSAVSAIEAVEAINERFRPGNAATPRLRTQELSARFPAVSLACQHVGRPRDQGQGHVPSVPATASVVSSTTAFQMDALMWKSLSPTLSVESEDAVIRRACALWGYISSRPEDVIIVLSHEEFLRICLEPSRCPETCEPGCILELDDADVDQPILKRHPNLCPSLFHGDGTARPVPAFFMGCPLLVSEHRPVFELVSAVHRCIAESPVAALFALLPMHRLALSICQIPDSAARRRGLERWSFGVCFRKLCPPSIADSADWTVFAFDRRCATVSTDHMVLRAAEGSSSRASVAAWLSFLASHLAQLDLGPLAAQPIVFRWAHQLLPPASLQQREDLSRLATEIERLVSLKMPELLSFRAPTLLFSPDATCFRSVNGIQKIPTGLVALLGSGGLAIASLGHEQAPIEVRLHALDFARHCDVCFSLSPVPFSESDPMNLVVLYDSTTGQHCVVAVLSMSCISVVFCGDPDDPRLHFDERPTSVGRLPGGLAHFRWMEPQKIVFAADAQGESIYWLRPLLRRCRSSTSADGIRISNLPSEPQQQLFFKWEVVRTAAWNPGFSLVAMPFVGPVATSTLSPGPLVAVYGTTNAGSGKSFLLVCEGDLLAEQASSPARPGTDTPTLPFVAVHQLIRPSHCLAVMHHNGRCFLVTQSEIWQASSATAAAPGMTGASSRVAAVGAAGRGTDSGMTLRLVRALGDSLGPSVTSLIATCPIADGSPRNPATLERSALLVCRSVAGGSGPMTVLDLLLIEADGTRLSAVACDQPVQDGFSVRSVCELDLF